MKAHQDVSPRQEARAERNLYQAILTLRNVEECRAFFRDLCTPAEIEAMSDVKARIEEVRIAAGPLMNLILAFAAAILMRIYVGTAREPEEFIANLFIRTVSLNVMLAVFNLIPLPPLDGSKVLARDCVASLKRWMQRDPAGATLLNRMDALDARDDRTLVLRLKRRDGGLLQSLGSAAFVMVAPGSVGTNPTAPNGTGPWRFVDWQRGNRIELARFDGYWGEKARLDRLRYRFIADPSAAYAAENPVSPDDMAATIFDCLGIHLEQEMQDSQGRPYPLCSGKPVRALVDTGAYPMYANSEQFAAFLKSEVGKWADVVKRSGAKLE